MKTKPLFYRNAVITGASSGIGRALALSLSQQGTCVSLIARREDLLLSLAKEIQAAGGSARVYAMDISDPACCEALIQKIDDEVGGLDLVIANAGIGEQQKSSALQWQHCSTMIDVNVRASVATLCAVLPRMVKRGSGHLVGISSLAQYRGLPRSSTYCATKAFLSTFLESLRVDLASVGIYVTDVRPGFVKTAMTEKNKSPMPFLWSLERANRVILTGIEKKRSVVAFPWPMVTGLRVLRLLPNPIFDLLVRRFA